MTEKKLDEEKLRRCIRCNGRRNVYKVGNNCYSLIDTGGVKMNCPLCNGTGSIPTQETLMKKTKIRTVKKDGEKRGHSK